jgi:hypothetical protein
MQRTVRADPSLDLSLTVSSIFLLILACEADAIRVMIRHRYDRGRPCLLYRRSDSCCARGIGSGYAVPRSQNARRACGEPDIQFSVESSRAVGTGGDQFRASRLPLTSQYGGWGPELRPYP